MRVGPDSNTSRVVSMMVVLDIDGHSSILILTGVSIVIEGVMHILKLVRSFMLFSICNVKYLFWVQSRAI